MKIHGKNGKRGFTLIELLVVISIILIIVSFAVPQIGGARAKARRAKCLANLRVLGTGLVMYADDNNGNYPGNLSGLYSGYVGDFKTFGCPSGDGATVSGGTVTSSDYMYDPTKSDESGSGDPVVCCKQHEGGECVLFATGAVRWVPSDELGTSEGQIDTSTCTEAVGS